MTDSGKGDWQMKNRFFWLTALLMMCMATNAYALEDGVYRDQAPGYGGDVIVKTVIRSGRLTEITTENTGGEKSEYYLKAEEALTAAILEKQSLEGIDTVSGATGTSESILSAMRGIFEQAAYTGASSGSVKEPSLTPKPHKTI